VAPQLQREGEDFDKNGFYAATQADERKSEGLFVEQMIMAADISDRVLKMMEKAKDDTERKLFQDSALRSGNPRVPANGRMERIALADRYFLQRR
jgi:hypothetical protein